jgi:hypothetical protein
MRKLMLISALCLLSASAQAGQSRDLVLAAADTPPATSTDTAQPLPPAAQNDTAKPESAQPRTSRPHTQARYHESDEAKARRIAAKYGISW